METEHILKWREITKRQLSIRMLILIAVAIIISTKIYLLLVYLDPILGIYTLITTILVFSAFIITYTRYRDPLSTLKPVHSQEPCGIISSNQWLEHRPSVIVIIPAKNDPELIREAVYSCLSSSYPKVRVTLINDGSTDNTGEVMNNLKSENPQKISVIHLPHNMGKRKAIREAINSGNAEGEIILVVDSDSIVERTAIERLVKLFQDPDVGAVTGHCRAMNADENVLTRLQDTWYDGQFSIMKAAESSFDTVTCCPGVLSAYRRQPFLLALERWSNDKFLGSEFVFGDDRHMTGYFLGGNQHYIDKNSKVWKVRYCESAKVYTLVPNKLKKFLLQQIRWKKSWVRVFLFNSRFYYKNRHPVMAIIYYLYMTWSLLSPIIAFRLLVVLPLQGNYTDALVYLSGLFFIGLLYGAEFRMRNPDSGNRWMYRLAWPLISIVLSPLQYYSILTIRRRSWLTR